MAWTGTIEISESARKIREDVALNEMLNGFMAKLHPDRRGSDRVRSISGYAVVELNKGKRDELPRYGIRRAKRSPDLVVVVDVEKQVAQVLAHNERPEAMNAQVETVQKAKEPTASAERSLEPEQSPTETEEGSELSSTAAPESATETAEPEAVNAQAEAAQTAQEPAASTEQSEESEQSPTKKEASTSEVRE